ncbi:MAG: NYN domain-containing protein [Victivallales bacterium]|nr:NYN domain-containing protein [Victivallales bacterium]
MVKKNGHFRTAVSKGGFKIQRENFRLPRTSSRLATVISRDSSLIQFFCSEGLKQCAEMKGLTDAYESVSNAWLKTHWSQWFRSLKDARPFGYAMLCDDRNQWAQRVGERLLGCPSFWAKAPFPMSSRHPVEKLAVEPADAKRDYWAFETNPARTQKAETRASREPDGNAAVAEATSKMSIHSTELMPLTKPAVADDGAGIAQADAVSPAAVATVNETMGMAEKEAVSTMEAIAPSAQGKAKGSSTSRLGDALRERDQLRKRLRIVEEVHAREMAAKDAELEELRNRLEISRREFHDAMAMLKVDTEREMKAQIADFEANALGVHPDLVTFAKQAVRTGEGLRERTTQMLQRQRETNKRYGTLQMLRDEIHKTDQMLSQVKLTVEEAIQPVPGMTELQRDLENHIDELRRRLHGDTGAELRNEVLVMPARLRAYIAEIPLDESGLAQFDAVQQMLESTLGQRLYGPEECQEALKQLERRRDLAKQGRECTRHLSETTDDKAVTGALKVIHQLTPYLERFAVVDLFVDAYNVIKQDPYWKRLEEAPNGFQEARRDFIRKCAGKARFFRSVTLVFDSDLPTTSIEHQGNLNIIYAAAKTEGQNADNYLVEHLAELADADEAALETHTRWLVTNDHELRLRVCNTCQAIVACQCFAIFMKS